MVPTEIHHRASLAGIIETWARVNPLAPALLAPGRRALHYGEFRTRLRHVAAALRSVGVTRSDRVAIVFPNGPEMAVAAVATAAYATCAPLNPAFRAEEFRFYFGDLRPKVLIVPATQAGLARTIAQDLGIRCVDAAWADAMPAGAFSLDGFDDTAPIAADAAGDDDIALVVHTSGTTSRPKLVPLTHGNLCRSAANVASTLELRPDDRCLNVMPLYHVHGFVGALLASLSAGGSVACAPGMQGGSFLDWLDELRPTWYTAVPTLHQAVLDELSRHPAGAASGRLRFVRSSSAPLPMQVARELETALDAPVVEAYGMTEAAHQIASNPLPPRPCKPGSVGPPAGPDVAIIDDAGQLVDRRMSGEIVIRGENVTPGYADDPDANDAAFVDGWFHTGDLGRIDSDGYISINGRLKEIINRGGEKVSPAEVDEALLDHPAVRQGIAFAVQHPTLGEDIAAAVVLKAGSGATEDELRQFLFGRLAPFKIPSRVLIVDHIPTGATGKIQRIGIAERLAGHLATKLVAPSNVTEAFIAQLFCEVLGIDNVGAAHNFFALGGDSLRGGQVLARVRARLGLTLSPLTLFKSPTVAEFAREIDDAREGSEGEKFAQMLERVEALTDDEAHRLLTRNRRRTPR